MVFPFYLFICNLYYVKIPAHVNWSPRAFSHPLCQPTHLSSPGTELCAPWHWGIASWKVNSQHFGSFNTSKAEPRWLLWNSEGSRTASGSRLYWTLGDLHAKGHGSSPCSHGCWELKAVERGCAQPAKAEITVIQLREWVHRVNYGYSDPSSWNINEFMTIRYGTRIRGMG